MAAQDTSEDLVKAVKAYAAALVTGDLKMVDELARGVMEKIGSANAKAKNKAEMYITIAEEMVSGPLPRAESNKRRDTTKSIESMG